MHHNILEYVQRIPLRILLFTLIALPFSSNAQGVDSTFTPHGQIIGYVFGDYFYKVHADSYDRGDYQYSRFPDNTNAFQLRRVYLGYKYAISKRFTAKVLMGLTGGTLNKKLSFYIKYASLRWSNIFPYSDMVIGEISTPTIAVMGDLWGYRSVEKTITDMHSSLSHDLGIKLTGNFGKEKNYGYTLMIGNGRGALFEDDRFKKYYADVYGKFFNKHLIIDLYADYERGLWEPNSHQSKTMFKAGLAYTDDIITIGVSVFTNFLKNSVVKYSGLGNVAVDILNGKAIGYSTFVRGPIIEDKLQFFARYDHLNPGVNITSSDKYYYKGLSSGYKNPGTVENFITIGIDYSPVKNVHFIPNIWFQSFTSQESALFESPFQDYDLVYRLTFYYRYD